MSTRRPRTRAQIEHIRRELRAKDDRLVAGPGPREPRMEPEARRQLAALGMEYLARGHFWRQFPHWRKDPSYWWTRDAARSGRGPRGPRGPRCP
jgi:hypothetical protein